MDIGCMIMRYAAGPRPPSSPSRPWMRTYTGVCLRKKATATTHIYKRKVHGKSMQHETAGQAGPLSKRDCAGAHAKIYQYFSLMQ